MPRTNRLQISGFPYHIVSRGNNKSALFYTNTDFKKFLRLLESARNKFPIKLYNYALMTNHFHLMLEPLQNDILSQAMESILKPYALYFNKRYNRTGHVFESRFKSYIIQTESYFFSCCRYINLNPVKAKMVTSPEKYMWSGFLSLANRQKDLVKMDHHELYLALGKSPEERKNAYSVLIRHQNDDYENRIKTGRTVIGNRNFKQQIKNLLSEH